MSEVLTQFDGRGNAIFVTSKERMHDETGTGDLGSVSSSPHARISYRAMYYDAASRPTAQVDVGTNGGSSYSRESSVPSRSDSKLVTSETYTSSGWLETSTDARGVVTKMVYDRLGRTTRRIEAYDASVSSGNPSGSNNRTTDTTYDAVGHVTALTATLPSSSQTTAYVYGVTTSTSGLSSNNLLAEVRYPDKSSGSASTSTNDRETYTYLATGEVASKHDGNGSTHAYHYDVLGRLVSDAVSTLGSSVDGYVRRLETAYDTGGRAFLFTSYSAATSGTVVNQVWRSFNGLGQLVAEWQAVGGAVTETSPAVQYTYSEMASSANHSRLLSMTYPNGRVLDYAYGSGLDDSVSRVTSLIDDSGSTHLEDYSYLGRGRLIKRAHPQPGVDYTMIKQGAEGTGDAGDQYTGLDRFGRLVDCRWIGSSAATDRFQYGYDRVGEKLHKDNKVNSTFSELYHANGASANTAYDPLMRMTTFRRGTLSGSPLDTVSTVNDPTSSTAPTFGSQSWTLDQLGNWSGVTSDGVSATRTHNAQNQLTGDGTISEGYDNNGNLTTQTSQTTNTWDAWNRAASIRGVSYTYDALGRRVYESAGGGREFFHSGWQVIETRTGDMSRAHEQFVYSLAYIDAVVLRDRDADGSSGTGSLGISGSGLEERLYFQQDREFNVTALVNTSGTVVERLAYDPFGSVGYFDASWTVRTSSSYANNIGFTGRWHDGTGMINFRARYWEGSLGRFVGRDQVGYGGGGMSLYASYFAPNFMDPMGLCCHIKSIELKNEGKTPIGTGGPSNNPNGPWWKYAQGNPKAPEEFQDPDTMKDLGEAGNGMGGEYLNRIVVIISLDSGADEDPADCDFGRYLRYSATSRVVGGGAAVGGGVAAYGWWASWAWPVYATAVAGGAAVGALGGLATTPFSWSDDHAKGMYSMDKAAGKIYVYDAPGKKANPISGTNGAWTKFNVWAKGSDGKKLNLYYNFEFDNHNRPSITPDGANPVTK